MHLSIWGEVTNCTEIIWAILVWAMFGELGLIRRSLLRRRLLEYNVDLYLNSMVEEVKQGKVLVTGGKEIIAESMIFAVGKQSNKGAAGDIGNLDCDVYYVGDCVKPSDLLNAIHGAFGIAREI